MSEDLYQLTATTLSGFEGILAAELRKLGARNVRPGKRAVLFEGDLGTIYKTNFRSRFALRILRPLKEFQARSETEYYDAIKSLPWETLITGDSTFAIKTVVNSEKFKHSGYMALKAKDAIVDRIREIRGSRPDVNTTEPDVPIHIHITNIDVTVSLNTTGASLHRRGYRKLTGQAPLNEVLAAGIVEMSGWDITTPFYDAMCGAGTLSIEAAIKGLNIPPGLFRKDGYAFENWPDFDKPLMDKIVESALGNISDIKLSIHASDISPNAMSKTKKNIYEAELEDEISASHTDFFELEPDGTRGTLILNPPYGERMNKEDIDMLYSKIGDTFKTKFKGFACFIFSANMGALKKVGLKSTNKISLMNGPLDCRLARYDIYEGSKRIRT